MIWPVGQTRPPGDTEDDGGKRGCHRSLPQHSICLAARAGSGGYRKCPRSHLIAPEAGAISVGNAGNYRAELGLALLVSDRPFIRPDGIRVLGIVTIKLDGSEETIGPILLRDG